MEKTTNKDPQPRIFLKGTVSEICSKNPEDIAVVALHEGSTPIYAMRLKVGELLQADVAYSGGVFDFIYDNAGITIRADKEANERKRVELNSLLEEFLQK